MADATISDDQPQNPGLRRFLKKTATYGVGAFLGGEFLAGCVKSKGLDASNHTVVGQDALFYGPTASLGSTLGEFKGTVVVEPGNCTPSFLKNSMAYASVIGINPTNQTPALVALRQAVNDANGWLLDATKNIQMSPSSTSVPMVDLRQQPVYDAMKAYLIELASNYPMGLFLDEMDSATFVEQQSRDTGANSNIYAGLTAKTIALIGEVNSAIAQMPGKKLTINGGLNELNPSDTSLGKVDKGDVFETLVGFISNFAKEQIYAYAGTDANGNVVITPYSQVRDKNGNLDLTDEKWLEYRLTSGAKAAVNAGKKSFNLLGIEPCIGNQSEVVGPTSLYYNVTLSNIKKSTGCNINDSIYLCDTAFLNAPDLQANLNLKPTQIEI